MSNRRLAGLAASALLAGGLLAVVGTAPAAADADLMYLWNDDEETPLTVIVREGCVTVDPPYRTRRVDNPTGYAVMLFQEGGCAGEFSALVNPRQEGVYLGRPADVRSVGFVATNEENGPATVHGSPAGPDGLTPPTAR